MFPMVDLVGVTHRFGDSVVLRPVSLQLQAGVVCAVQGPNGAGKTTLLRIAAGLLVPSAGRRTVSGVSLYLRSGSGARRGQRVRDALRGTAGLCGRAAIEADRALRRVGLDDFGDRRIEALSAGQRARLSLGLVLVVDPVLACLDEPTVHLDAEGCRLAAQVIAELADRGTALLVATHDEALAGAADTRLRLVDGQVERLEVR